MTLAALPRWEVLYAEAHAERFRFLAGTGRAEFLRESGALAVATGAWSNTDQEARLRARRLRNDARKRRAVRAAWLHHAARRGPALVLSSAATRGMKSSR